MNRLPCPRSILPLVLAASLLSACSLWPGTRQATSPEPVAPAQAGGDALAQPASPLPKGPAQPDIATRHALFKVSSFDQLPGWQQDNLTEAWAAFKESCKALARKPGWKALCTQVRSIQDPQVGRALLEREFTLLTVQNTDRTREGEITGYYEPLLQGQATRAGAFVVPVYGVPHDMYFLDWKTLPANQRKGVVWLRPHGRLLMPAPSGQAGAVQLNLAQFTLDTLDRRLRVRLQGGEGLPYYTRADIQRQARFNAPVLAWVDDPVALYAMQVQGAGRIRLPDGQILRLQYADQNGHPFKPMQLAAQGKERVQTRGANDAPAMADELEQFELAASLDDAELAAQDANTADTAEPLTRGGRPRKVAGDEVAATVASLTPPAGSQGATPGASGPAKPIDAKARTAPVAQAGSQQVLDHLLGQAQAAPAKPRKAAAPVVAGSAQLPGKVPEKVPRQSAATVPAGQAVAGASAALLSQRSRALDSDPSYVFFRVAPDQNAQGGPVGALGVPLTAGRSLAVDPRVLPLGYPVFLDAGGKDKRPDMQRLMFAQDTGGAIRGAVRADYFWGFGADAGRQARRTKHRGRMWVMVPHAEVQALLSSKLVTRGAGVGQEVAQTDRECLVDDAQFCVDALDDPAAP